MLLVSKVGMSAEICLSSCLRPIGQITVAILIVGLGILSVYQSSCSAIRVLCAIEK